MNNKSKEVSIQVYEGNPVTFDLTGEHRFINLSQMAKPFGKKPNDFLRQSSTQRFIDALLPRYGNSRNGMIRIVQGGNEKEMQGTWAQELLALKFAGWLSPAFEVWMMERIREMLTGNVGAIPSLPTGETDDQRECRRLIDELVPIVGSAAKLALRLGVSDATVSLARNGNWEGVKTPILARMLQVLRHLAQHGTGYDPHMIDLLMRIDDTEVRTTLFHKLKTGSTL